MGESCNEVVAVFQKACGQWKVFTAGRKTARYLRHMHNMSPDNEREACISKLPEGFVENGGEQASIDNALAAIGVGVQQLGIFIYVGGCWMSDAMEVMLVAVLAPAVGCEWSTSPEGQSLLAASVFTGMMLASSVWGVVADLAGRKVAFGAAAGLAATAGLASALAPSFIWLVILRLLVGCGLVGVLPMYTLLEEWLPRDSGGKGKWLVALQVWWSVGTVLEGLLALWLLNAYGWRVLLAASSVPLACILTALPWVPESPHYLAATGRLLESRRVLVAAAKRNGTAARLEQHLQVHATEFTVGIPPDRGQQWRQVQQIAVEDAEANITGNSATAAVAMGDGNGGQVLGCGRSSTPELHLEVAADSFPGQSISTAVPSGGGECCCGNGDEANGGNDGDGRSCTGRLVSCRRCHGRNAAAATASSALGWCRELTALGRILLGPELVGRTWRLAITWFACALSYYGVAILVPYVAAGSLRDRDGNGGAAAADNTHGGKATGSCAPWPGGTGLHLVLPRTAYVSMMAAALAELPSMAWAFLTVDRWNRRNVVAFSLAVTAAALAPIVMAQASAERMPMMMPPPQPDLNATAADSHTTSVGSLVALRRRRLYPGWLTSPSMWWLPLASVLLARLFVSGAFTLLYVLTPEQYPPRIHGSALGAANTLARLGALAAPFVAVALPQHGQLPMALGLMAAACCVAALAVGSLRGGKPNGA